MKIKPPYIIFIVEDDAVFLKTVEFHLKEHLKYNIDIHSFTNGEECLKNMNLKPSIVVLDYFLNNQNPLAQNGLEILKKIKKTNPETEVIILSAQDKIQIAVNTMIYGAFTYLTKNEVALFRLEHTIVNILKIIKLRETGKSARKGEIVVMFVLAAIAAAAVCLYLFVPNVWQEG